MATRKRLTQKNQDSQPFDLLPDAIYWPFEQLPESKLEAYALACVETALHYSEDAREAYAKVVSLWELPGCQTLIGDFNQCKQDTRNWLRDRAKATIGEPLPTWPDSWRDIVAKAEGNTDFIKLCNYGGHFVLKAFNRKADLENGTPKVLAGKSPCLAQVIAFCSLLDYLQRRPELKGPRVISDSELVGFYLFCQTLASNPTTRFSRQVKRQTTQTLRKRGFDLHHYSKILKVADQWYQCRVNPGTIEAYLDKVAWQAEKYLDRGNVENAIAPFDEATGYPRKWRK
jgi:hypothetical protein